MAMRSVKVRRSRVSLDQAAEVIRRELGDGVQVEADGGGILRVRKGLARAKVSVHSEPGATVFDVAGEGASMFPLVNVTTKALNDRGIARRTAEAIGEAEAFRDDG